MMSMSHLAALLDRPFDGADVSFRSVSTDTRTLDVDELFFAISGPNFDANEFVDAAGENGAVGAVIGRSLKTTLPTIVVEDTVDALGRFAKAWRSRFDLPIFGVTGSNGKTSVKEMLGAIVSRWLGDGVVSSGNLNNHIGLPLSILKLREHSKFGVFEMGMNHEGEIRYLTQICKPTIAVINNAAEAHLEGLGSVERVAHAKAEIFSGLAEDGVAVINADDEFASLWRQIARPSRLVSFGLDTPGADYSASYRNISDDHSRRTEINVTTPHGELQTELYVPGRHNVANALAATACAVESGAPTQLVAQALREYRPVDGRLREHADLGNTTVIDDSYNANPASMRAAIDVLAQRAGTRILVLGQMAELGVNETSLHHEVGEYARSAGIDALYAVGPLSKSTIKGFGSNGRFIESTDGLVDSLLERVNTESDRTLTLLVKGSRSMQMEKVVEQLVRALGNRI